MPETIADLVFIGFCTIATAYGGLLMLMIKRIVSDQKELEMRFHAHEVEAKEYMPRREVIDLYNRIADRASEKMDAIIEKLTAIEISLAGKADK
ncbi:MAG: hypothetical protein EOM21_20620 [Gammaproteobacteria bacterium]|nr:hypothetical protein [Gammaproteobacteria bacterium]